MRTRSVVLRKAGRFYVSLLLSQVQALHFTPWLNESAVGFNTLVQGTWGPGESGAGIPFPSRRSFGGGGLLTTTEGFPEAVRQSEVPPLPLPNPPARTCLLDVDGKLQLGEGLLSQPRRAHRGAEWQIQFQPTNK
ncbi:galectin-7-like [Crocuta crocuta]